MTYKRRKPIKQRSQRPGKQEKRDYRKAQMKLAAERDNCTCRHCGKGQGATIIDWPHHVIKRSTGGSDELNNLVTLCRTCHNRCHFLEEPYLYVRANPELELLEFSQSRRDLFEFSDEPFEFVA